MGNKERQQVESCFFFQKELRGLLRTLYAITIFTKPAGTKPNGPTSPPRKSCICTPRSDPCGTWRQLRAPGPGDGSVEEGMPQDRQRQLRFPLQWEKNVVRVGTQQTSREYSPKVKFLVSTMSTKGRGRQFMNQERRVG